MGGEGLLHDYKMLIFPGKKNVSWYFPSGFIGPVTASGDQLTLKLLRIHQYVQNKFLNLLKLIFFLSTGSVKHM